MDIMTLMAQFADPESLKNLSLAQKLTASLITTLLGMGITFVSLGILQFVIGLLERFTRVKAPAVQQQTQTQLTTDITEQNDDRLRKDEELVAAITVALAIQLGTAASNIVIRNIRRVEDSSPAWSRVGLAELMNNNG